MIKIRQDKSANYKAVFFNGKTIRMRLDNTKPILTPTNPEIEDVSINSKCFANCRYCYTSATKFGSNFDNVVEKAHLVWGSLPETERPFQIAIGGAGESTIHPDWVEFIKATHSLGIMPNYTTNGMHTNSAILQTTEAFCGGVAISYHPHIEKVFHKAIADYSQIKTRLNVHVILGDEESLKALQDIYDKYSNVLDYLVVLPYQAAGRGKPIDTKSIWLKAFDWINSVQSEKFAFGALFYNFLLENKVPLEMSIYEPEIYSGYRMMDSSFQTLRRSSYDLRPKLM
jgi:organic radical activating enzyme